MPLFTLVLISGTAALGGLVLRYFLRWLITLGQKGSMELTIKQMILEAKDQAQKIVEQAETEAGDKLKEIKEAERVQTLELKTREERLLKKDDLLDKRQSDIDREIENLKHKLHEVEQSKARAVASEKAREEELRRVANLSPEEAKAEIMKTVEQNAEADLVARMRKLTVEHNDK